MEFCPTCGRKDFKSKSGRTLHIKNCKGPQSKDPTEPCPKCGKDDFSSTSGRSLHIKSCKGPKVTEYVCNCGQVFTKRFALTNHAKYCNFEGTTYDKRLKVNIRGRVSCSCPAKLHDVMSCSPMLGVNSADDLESQGCWIEGWGPCVYASGIKTDKPVKLMCKERARHRSIGKKKSEEFIED